MEARRETGEETEGFKGVLFVYLPRTVKTGAARGLRPLYKDGESKKKDAGEQIIQDNRSGRQPSDEARQ